MLRRLFIMAEDVAATRIKASAPRIGTHKLALIDPSLRRNSANPIAFVVAISMLMKS